MIGANVSHSGSGSALADNMHVIVVQCVVVVVRAMEARHVSHRPVHVTRHFRHIHKLFYLVCNTLNWVDELNN